MNPESAKRRVIAYIFFVLTLASFICALAFRVSVKEEKPYHTAREVALYVKKYEKLPYNFMDTSVVYSYYAFPTDSTPEDAVFRAIAYNYNVGGDVLAPDVYLGKKGAPETAFSSSDYFMEADIYEHPHAVIAKRRDRGSCRIVFNNSGEVYYTTDNFETFKKMTKFRINGVSYVSWAVFASLMFFAVVSLVIINNMKNVTKKEVVIVDIWRAFERCIYLVIIAVAVPAYHLKRFFKWVFFGSRRKKKNASIDEPDDEKPDFFEFEHDL